MPTFEYALAEPPSTERERELWLQHAVGFVLFQDVRGYAIDKLDHGLSPEARAAALKAIDDALYGLMMVLDGVTGVLQNADQAFSIKTVARLLRREPSEEGEVIAEVDLGEGDGMCMGYHLWRGGDFGNDPIAVDKNHGQRS